MRDLDACNGITKDNMGLVYLYGPSGLLVEPVETAVPETRDATVLAIESATGLPIWAAVLIAVLVCCALIGAVVAGVFVAKKRNDAKSENVRKWALTSGASSGLAAAAWNDDDGVPSQYDTFQAAPPPPLFGTLDGGVSSQFSSAQYTAAPAATHTAPLPPMPAPSKVMSINYFSQFFF